LSLEAESAKDIYFIFLDFANEPLRACTGTRTYNWGEYSWLGIGEIAGISEVADSADIAARPLNFALAGTDSFITAPALSRTNYKGRQAVVYRGFLNPDESLVDEPYAVWSGTMDVGTATYDNNEAGIEIQCEPLASRFLRPNISRYSDQDHQLRWPGDKFYEYLPQMAEKDVIWGGQRAGPSGNFRDVGPGDTRPIYTQER